MAKKKTKKEAAADREARRRGVMAGVAAVVVLGIGAGAMFGVGALEERAARELRAPADGVEIVWPALEAQTPDSRSMHKCRTSLSRCIWLNLQAYGSRRVRIRSTALATDAWSGGERFKNLPTSESFPRRFACQLNPTPVAMFLKCWPPDW